VLEDCNINDESVMFCRSQCLEKFDYIGFAISSLLLKMTKTQRMKMCYMDK